MDETQDARPGRVRRRPSARPSAAIDIDAGARYSKLRNPFDPIRVFSDDEVENIHVSALSLLESAGMRVLSAPARARFAAAGADVDESTQTVRLDRGLVETALATAPRTFELQARVPRRNVTIGDRHLAIAPVVGPPNVLDRERGRRPGTLKDFCDFIKLCQHYPSIHILGGCVEPQDVALNVRHLELTHAQLTLSDKPPFIFCRGSGQIADCFALICLAHGIPQEEFVKHAYAYTVVNTNSPRQLDTAMAEGIIDFAQAGQMVIITPFTLAGAMAPVTIAGALTLAHLEALVGITLAQIARPGAPVVYGTFTSNVDMKSGAPAFGTPEFTKACFGAGQLARRLGIPWRSSNATASNCPDAQSAYEAEMSIWGAVLAGCDVMLHGAGWLEGGLSASLEKFVLDIEMLQMMAELFQPLTATPEDIASEAILGVDPGGHFFASPHTMQRYRTAFYTPLVSDRRNYGQWEAAGAMSAAERATAIWKKVLGEFEAPVLDTSAVEALTAYVQRRSHEGGALPPS